MLAVERPVVLPQGSSRIVLLAFTGPLVPRRGVATALAGAVDSGATIVATHLLPVALHLPMMRRSSRARRERESFSVPFRRGSRRRECRRSRGSPAGAV